MLETVSQHAKRQRLSLGDRLVPSIPVGQNTRKIDDLSDPPAIVLAIDLYREVTHIANRTPSLSARQVHVRDASGVAVCVGAQDADLVAINSSNGPRPT
ncbi:MAG: hypothetical protein QOC81_14 [Thermoanaerobaculia bacterium]|nr:hypothetical protein [Thermoanaerobaculia bacterium]